jgi:hypothetical protein
VTTCTVCGEPLAIGDFPCISTPRPHARALPSKGYEPHFDVSLGEYVNGWGDVRKHMRRKRLDFFEHASDGEMSARRDRMEERKRAEGRRA